MNKPATLPDDAATLMSELTPQEMRVLQASRDERPLQDIAKGLNVNIETVRSHRKHILKKWLLITDQETGGCAVFRKMMRLVESVLT